MPHSNDLARILDVLLDDNTGGDLLNETLDHYRDILLTASGIDLGGQDSLDCVHTGAGVAIGTTWAALCIDDLLRTKRFVSGLYAAVKTVADRRPGPVHLMYAGTGPWATLALPLTSRFTPDELRLTLIEINEGSFASVQRTVEQLGLSDYVEEFIKTDAATHVIAGRLPVDVMLSETMQYCLIDEMQVPIVLNLMRQLPAEVIMVPERITIHLGVLNDDDRQLVNREIAPILTIDRDSLRAYEPSDGKTDFPTFRLPVPELGTDTYGLLALLTTIDVYGGYGLTHYESGLTYPQIIGDYPSADNPLTAIDFTYHLDPTPLLGMYFLVEGELVAW
jgi:predicted RNA methylase